MTTLGLFLGSASTFLLIWLNRCPIGGISVFSHSLLKSFTDSLNLFLSLLSLLLTQRLLLVLIRVEKYSEESVAVQTDWLLSWKTTSLVHCETLENFPAYFSNTATCLFLPFLVHVAGVFLLHCWSSSLPILDSSCKNKLPSAIFHMNHCNKWGLNINVKAAIAY